MMTPAFEHYAKLSNREFASGQFAKLTADCPNDYKKEALPIVPDGTILQIDFGGDFGVYALADINGTMHKVKIELSHIHHIKLVGA